jgi:hypothetical protein
VNRIVIVPARAASRTVIPSFPRSVQPLETRQYGDQLIATR